MNDDYFEKLYSQLYQQAEKKERFSQELKQNYERHFKLRFKFKPEINEKSKSIADTLFKQQNEGQLTMTPFEYKDQLFSWLANKAHRNSSKSVRQSSIEQNEFQNLKECSFKPSVE